MFDTIVFSACAFFMINSGNQAVSHLIAQSVINKDITSLKTLTGRLPTGDSVFSVFVGASHELRASNSNSKEASGILCSETHQLLKKSLLISDGQVPMSLLSNPNTPESASICFLEAIFDNEPQLPVPVKNRYRNAIKELMVDSSYSDNIRKLANYRLGDRGWGADAQWFVSVLRQRNPSLDSAAALSLIRMINTWNPKDTVKTMPLADTLIAIGGQNPSLPLCNVIASLGLPSSRDYLYALAGSRPDIVFAELMLDRSLQELRWFKLADSLSRTSVYGTQAKKAIQLSKNGSKVLADNHISKPVQ